MGMAAPVWAGVSRLLASAPGQFWNERPASDWSEKEIEQLLSRSPWAKDAEAQFKMPGGDGPQSGGPGGGGGGMGGPRGGGGGGGMGGPPGGGGGGGMGGPPGGGMGGPGGGGPGGGMPQMKATVRWESAAPIVEARKTQPDPEAAENYIVSVSGLPLFGGPPPGGGSGGPPPVGGPGAPAGGGRPNRPAPTAEQRKAMIGTLKETSALQRKGKNPIAAVRVGELESSGPPTLLFYFPRAGDPVSLADKEVIFLTRIGPLQLKVKFAVKDMQYHGQVSL